MNLESLRDLLLLEILRRIPAAEEGRVACVGGPSYRRVDWGGRALAYLRLHRKSAPRVRVDVTGWFGPVKDPGARPCAGGSATLWVSNEGELDSVVELLAGLISGRSAEASKHEEDEDAGDRHVQPKWKGEA